MVSRSFLPMTMRIFSLQIKLHFNGSVVFGDRTTSFIRNKRGFVSLFCCVLIPICTHCEYAFGQASADIPGNNSPVSEQPAGGSCNEKEVFTNMRWFNSDAARSQRSAWVQGRLLRASSVSARGNPSAIRSAYKDGQDHNYSAAGLIDECDDDEVTSIAYKFAENVVRLKTCDGRSPASSATCSDVTENIRWSLLDNQSCSVFARQYLAKAVSTGDEKISAELVRRAVQVAEGHRPDLAKSVDFVSDHLLVTIARRVFFDYQVDALDRRPADLSNPFTVQACPGVLLASKFD